MFDGTIGLRIHGLVFGTVSLWVQSQLIQIKYKMAKTKLRSVKSKIVRCQNFQAEINLSLAWF